MFKKGDEVFHNDYGNGIIWRVEPSNTLKFKDKNDKPLVVKGTIKVAFDSEMGEDDGNGGQKTTTFLMDGRGVPEGAGYFWNDIFNEYISYIELTKI